MSNMTDEKFDDVVEAVSDQEFNLVIDGLYFDESTDTMLVSIEGLHPLYIEASRATQPGPPPDIVVSTEVSRTLLVDPAPIGVYREGGVSPLVWVLLALVVLLAGALVWSLVRLRQLAVERPSPSLPRRETSSQAGSPGA